MYILYFINHKSLSGIGYGTCHYKICYDNDYQLLDTLTSFHSFIFHKSLTRYGNSHFYSNTKKQQHTVYTYKICEKFVSVYVSNIQ
jgi:hypothetical protein